MRLGGQNFRWVSAWFASFASVRSYTTGHVFCPSILPQVPLQAVGAPPPSLVTDFCWAGVCNHQGLLQGPGDFSALERCPGLLPGAPLTGLVGALPWPAQVVSCPCCCSWPLDVTQRSPCTGNMTCAGASLSQAILQQPRVGPQRGHERGLVHIPH